MIVGVDGENDEEVVESRVEKKVTLFEKIPSEIGVFCGVSAEQRGLLTITLLPSHIINTAVNPVDLYGIIDREFIIIQTIPID